MELLRRVLIVLVCLMFLPLMTALLVPQVGLAAALALSLAVVVPAVIWPRLGAIACAGVAGTLALAMGLSHWL